MHEPYNLAAETFVLTFESLGKSENFKVGRGLGQLNAKTSSVP